MYCLVIQDPESGRRKQIRLNADLLTIGSGAGNSVVLRRPGVEEVHCTLERTPSGFKLVDHHTEAGTLVNGTFIAQKRMEPGDRVELGGYLLVFEGRDDELAAVASAEAETPTVGSAPPAAPATPPAAPAAPQVPRAAARSPVMTPSSAASTSAASAQADGGGAGVGLAPRRRREGGPMRVVRTLLFTATALLLVAGLSSVVPDLLGSASAGTYGKDRLALVAALRDAGQYAQATRVLNELRMEDDSGVTEDTVKSERTRTDRERVRQEHARESLRQVAGDQSLTAGERYARVRDLLDAFGDLIPVGEEIEQCLVELKAELGEGERNTRATLQDKIATSDSLLESSNFSGALGIWRELEESDRRTDAFALAAAREEIEALADAEAARLLVRADEACRTGNYMEALVVLDVSELTSFRGTRAFSELEGRANVLEELLRSKRPTMSDLAGSMPVEESGIVGRDPRPERQPIREPETEAPEVPAISSAEARQLDDAIDAGDHRFFAGEPELAVEIYGSGLSPSLDFENRLRLSRRIRRANGARWFLDALRNHVEARPERVAEILVQSRDGALEGRIVGVEEGQFLLSSGAETLALRPLDLNPNSARALARVLDLSPEDRLNQLFFAMMTGAFGDGAAPSAKVLGGELPAEADGLLRRALDDPSLKGGADSAIAFLRGMEPVPEWGYFRHERSWLTFREREHAQNLTALGAAVAKLGKKDEDSYRLGLEEMKALLPVARQDVLGVLKKRRAGFLADLLAQSEVQALHKLTSVRAELETRREHALELIFDTEKYFYPYAHRQTEYSKVQQEVDARAAAVREIWGNEHREPEGGVPLSNRFIDLLDKLATEQELLALGDPDNFREEDSYQFFKLLPRDVRRVNIRNYAMDEAERARLDRDVVVLAVNASGRSVAERAEIEQIQVTNGYRLMMGRQAVRVHDALVRAARGHCNWMSRSGTFSHFNHEDPELRTPIQRIHAQGYMVSGSGENIARVGGAMGAHNAWLHSSGHHRNILYKTHTELGVGNMGAYWCQNFAGEAEYSGNLLDDF